jgi:DNA-binding PadR family transcriptional regulator
MVSQKVRKNFKANTCQLAARGLSKTEWAISCLGGLLDEALSLCLEYGSYDIVHMSYMGFEFGTWEIAVLALLREAPMHPYQMQRLLHLRHKDEILALKRGSLYHAIGRLSQSGLIEVEKTGREGRRPARTTYRITPAGAKAFLDALRKMVATPGRESSECMTAMSFLVHLDPEEARQLLEQRALNLDSEISRITAALTVAGAHVARINLIESEYRRAALKAERTWVRALESEIRARKLTWSLKGILREAEADRRAAGQRRKES